MTLTLPMQTRHSALSLHMHVQKVQQRTSMPQVIKNGEMLGVWERSSRRQVCAAWSMHGARCVLRGACMQSH